VILVLDTSTRTPVVALSQTDGTLVAERHWSSNHRHGEELLQHIDELLAEAGVAKSDIEGVIVGTGPGSFTGLRIGLATAKTVAYSLSIPIVGVSSTLALAVAAGRGDGEVTVTLPAGASDRYVHRIRIKDGQPKEARAPQLVAGGEVAPEAVAVDIERAPASALEAGMRAVAGLATALARFGSQQIASGQSEDAAQLVPAYVALPRGIAKAVAEMEWSPDLR